MREISCGNFGLEKMGEIPTNETVKIYGLNNNFNWNGYNNTYKKILLNSTIDVDDDFYSNINENGYNQFEMEKLSCIVDLIRLFQYDVCDIHEENDEPIDSRDIKIVKKLYRCLNKAVQEETNSNLQFDYQSDFRYMDDYNNNIFDILDFNSSDDEDEIVKHFKNIIFDDNFFILHNIEY